MNGFILGGNIPWGLREDGDKKNGNLLWKPFVTKEQLKVASTEPDVMVTMHKKQKQSKSAHLGSNK